MDLYEYVAEVLEADQHRRFKEFRGKKLRFLDNPFELELYEFIIEMRKLSQTYRWEF